MRIHTTLIASMAGALLACCEAAPDASGSDTLIAVRQLLETPVPAETRQVVERDAVYRRAKTYLGAPFSKYLELAGVQNVGEVGDTLVQFVCADGYNPLTSLKVLLADEAFLAVRDAAAPPAEMWEPFPTPGPKRTPAPAYLVWPRAAEDPSHPWPYGIVGVRIGSAGAMLGPAEPVQSTARPGYELFLQHCLKCHSINGVGGTMGVDLNVPRNVYEYWQGEALPDFILNPESYRLHSKMPAFPNLRGTALTQILHYIESMGAVKRLPRSELAPGSRQP
jgi:mono/diheme cytochrome c family protein